MVDGPGASQRKMVQLMVRWTIVQILLVVLVVMVSMMVQLMKLNGIRAHAIFCASYLNLCIRLSLIKYHELPLENHAFF